MEGVDVNFLIWPKVIYRLFVLLPIGLNSKLSAPFTILDPLQKFAKFKMVSGTDTVVDGRDEVPGDDRDGWRGGTGNVVDWLLNRDKGL